MEAVVGSKQEPIVIESTKTDSIVTGEAGGSITNREIYTVVVEVESTQTVAAGAPGPAGPPGISEEQMAYAKQTDFASDTVIYRGEAEVGTTTSSSGWRIRKITLAVDGDVSETWAGGTANFDKIWDNRASLIYS